MVVSVTDQEDGTPALQSPDPNEPHGRGLRIVEALSDEWGISSNAIAGKSVWFRMSLESSVADASSDGTDRVHADQTAARRRSIPGASPKDSGSRPPVSRDRGPRPRGNSRQSVTPAVQSTPVALARSGPPPLSAVPTVFPGRIGGSGQLRSRAAKRSPCDSARSTTSSGPKTNSEGSPPSAHAATSSQVTGVDARGSGRDRSEYVATVVLAG